LILFAVLAGCGQDSKLGSVYGTVRLDEKPVTKGTVRFVPAAGRAATGKIQSDGTFTLGTYGESDGALLGTHKVAVIAYDAAEDSRPAYEVRNVKSTSLVPERYMSVGTSEFSFEVKPGKNQADFDLKSK
jgi:hypothetical protein